MAKLNQAMQDLLRYNASILPQKRSSFNKSHSHTTTFDSAYLVPLMWDRVLPGDEKKIRYSGLARMATPIHPVMDEANLDVWAFFIPDRLWWSHAKEFYGENLDASFNPDGAYEMPSLLPSQFFVDPSRGADRRVNGIGSLNDYFGLPIGDLPMPDVELLDNGDVKVTAGLHRCYQLIWNEYYRNSSVQPALRLSTGDSVTDDEWSVIREIRKVCKLPDFFTSLLKEPQAGDDVLLPLGDWAPVVSRDKDIPDDARVSDAMRVGDYYDVDNSIRLPGTHQVFGASVGGYFNGVSSTRFVQDLLGSSSSSQLNYLNSDLSKGPASSPMNLWADLSSATSATVNNLRAAVTIQQLLEIDSMAGKRYQNILQAHFGVFTPDATLQRPELLGATRTPIGMRQVLQTSASEADSPQGNTAAFSLTNVANEWICNKSFTEPGFIMVLGAVRPIHSYSQGIDPLLTKLNRYDHYYPVFDNLGNQPVPTSAIYFTYNPDNGATEHPMVYADNVLGYQEAWTEYRIRPNRVSGLMRPDLVGGDQHGSLATWNYSSNFNAPPVLNSAFVEEDEFLIDRVIAVQDEPQFILDSYFEYIDVKSMSVHSVPGLLRL